MSGSSDSETTTTAEPWGPSQPYLKSLFPQAENLFQSGGFAPETFQQATGQSTVAGQSNATQQAQGSMIQQAMRGINNGSILDQGNRTVNQMAAGRMNGFTKGAFNGLRGEMRQGAVDTDMNGMQRQAMGGLSSMMRPGGQSNAALSSGMGGLQEMQSGEPGMTFADISQQLQGAKDRALAGAIPAAAAQFTGSGLGNSSAAQEAVGRSAIDAIAPYEYSAAEQGLNRAQTSYENAQQRALSASGSLASLGDSQQARGLQATGMLGQMGAGQQALEYNADTADRSRDMSAAGAMAGMGSQYDDTRLRASGMAPSMYQSSFMPQQMLGQVGAQQDAYGQAQRDAAVRNYGQASGRPQQNLQGYLSALMGAGGMGRSQTASAPGASGMETVAGAGLGGLGTYGGLLSAGVASPLAIGGGALAGLMGLL